MGIIMPSGKNIRDWSPQYGEDGLVRTASANNQDADNEQSDDREALYKAAQSALLEDGVDDEVVEPSEEVEETGEFGTEDVSDSVEEGDEGIEEEAEGTPEEEAGEALEKAEDAIEEAGEAVSDAKQEVAPEADEIDIPLDSEEGSVVEVEVDEDLDIPGETEEDGEVVVEGENCEEDEDTELEASTSKDFVKLAKISPDNRKKLYDFWKNQLGFPEDYCKLLVKDHE